MIIEKKKVLIIEDDVDIANLEKDYLEINNYDVDICDDGKNALDIIKNNIIDCVILDLMLPNVSGFDICKEIRKISQIPVIIVSAKTEPSDIILGLGLGSDDYVKKPFDPQELVARVNSHISRYDSIKGIEKHEDVISFDNIKLGFIPNFLHCSSASLTFEYAEIPSILYPNRSATSRV